MLMSPRVFYRFFNSNIVKKVRHGTRYIFKKHLLLTNLSISAGLSSVGDCIEQNYEIISGDQEKYDVRRTAHMGVTGVTIGVVCHYWYIILDKRLPGRTLKIAVKKMLLDQILCSPVTISTFFVTTAILEQSSVQDAWKEIKCKAWRLYAAEWVIWPPAQLINFLYIPLRYRVLYDNTISTCYDIYTSYVKHDRSANCQGIDEFFTKRKDSVQPMNTKAENAEINLTELPHPLSPPPTPVVVSL